MKKVLVVGDIYSETQYFVDRIPGENEFSIAPEAVTTIGSKTVNVARTLAKLGNQVAYCGVTGDDSDSVEANSKLKGWGITPMLSKVVSLPTGKITVITPKSGKSSIVLSAGANQELSIDTVISLETRLKDFNCVYTSTALPLESLYALVTTCIKCSVPVFLDVPNKQVELDMGKVASVNFFMPNRQETSLLIGKEVVTIDDAVSAVQKIRESIVNNIIVTLDKDGCILLAKDEQVAKHFPAQIISAVDETGAGDIFRGAFVSQWLETEDLEQSIEYALKLATNSVLTNGVNNSIMKVG